MFHQISPLSLFLRSFPVTPITRTYTDLYYHRLTLLARKKGNSFPGNTGFFSKKYPQGLLGQGDFFDSSGYFLLFHFTDTCTWFSNPVLVNFLVSSSGISSVVNNLYHLFKLRQIFLAENASYNELSTVFTCCRKHCNNPQNFFVGRRWNSLRSFSS